MDKEDILIQIRDKLRKDGIKLWLSPYYSDKGSVDSEILNLSKTLSSSVKAPFFLCEEVIKELQINSLENLKQKNRFDESGLATLKIKVINQEKSPINIRKELMLTCSGMELKQQISDEISININRLKLICTGKVLNNEESLIKQGVKNGYQILAIVLTENPEEIEKYENSVKEIETIKTDSKLLANDQQYMRLEDQFGNTIKIPEAEKTALIVAMTLHEKGRAALKRDDYSAALIFFLEADQEFRNCSSNLLKTVDNYALLNLDIAWCYLCLQSFNHLPEAEERLKKCEEKFKDTYGANLERLIAVKGNAGNEACLFARLNLLQAVVLYHQNKRSESLALFKNVQEKLQNLKVDDNSVLTLVELGYSVAEARLGLRVTNGDVNLAANYIEENRKKRYQSRKKALAEEILEKERQKLGKCADGQQFVDPNFVKLLVNMGYNKEIARRALKTCNNVISDSIEYIQDNPIAGSSQSKSFEFLSLIEDLVPQLVEAGFDPRMAKIALQKHNGDIILSTEELLNNEGLISGDLSMFDITEESLENIRKRRKSLEESKEDAFERLKNDISMIDDDHLDITLDQEHIFLNKYLSLLEK